jgi:hypothetical protein
MTDTPNIYLTDRPDAWSTMRWRAEDDRGNVGYGPTPEDALRELRAEADADYLANA